MTYRIASLTLRIHPLLPLYLLLMFCAGIGPACLIAMICVLMHEMGHLLAARFLGACADELTVMPMGGVLHVCGLYKLSRRKVILICLAGPLVNLALAFIGFRYPNVFSVEFVITNLILFIFNLLPALPLDGGRLLAAVLSSKLGYRRALRLAALSGRLLGAGLIAYAIFHWIFSGQILLPHVITAVYLISCAASEADVCELSTADELMRLMNLNRLLQPMPVQMIRCEASIQPDQLLRMLRPDRCTVIEWLETGQWESDLSWLKRQIKS